MRIALTADPLIPVPPEIYGGIERMIDFLVTGLQHRGHEVVLVAHGASKAPVRIIPYKSAGGSRMDHVNNALTINQLRGFRPDIIHSFSRLAYLLPFMRSSLPKIMSYQREPTLTQVKRAVSFAGKKSLAFTGCSDYITNKITPFADAKTVYNGVDVSKYTFVPEVGQEGPLVFLGRLEPVKGIRTAIDVALKAGKKLVIAGNIPAEYTGYFNEEINPLIRGDIQYIGPVNDEQKNRLLGAAAALLMPIAWNEPFGIVMAEAMACGTPVIGFNRGAVPEVIKNGVNGYRCDTAGEMTGLVQRIGEINRHTVRQDVESRFSSDVIISRYLEIYKEAVSRNK